MWILLILLFCIFLFNYFFNLKEFLAPGVLFSVSFIFCACWALSYMDEWGTQLAIQTNAVIVGGVFVYSLTTLIVRAFFYKGTIVRKAYVKPGAIYIPAWKENVFIIYVVVSFVLYAYEIRSVTGIDSLNQAITAYRRVRLVSDQIYQVPRIMNLMRISSIAGGFWFAYVFARNLAYAKKIEWRALLIIVVGALNFVLSGGRSGFINIIVATAGMYFLFKLKENGTNHVLSVKQIILLIVAMIIGLALFQQFGNLVRSNIKRNMFDYLAIYCGGQFHNLNEFITNRMEMVDRSFWGSQTLKNILSTILKIAGVEGYYYNYDIPYIFSNGYFLGNVGTTFYALVYDFGYAGCMVMTAIMAAITEFIYEFSKSSEDSYYPPFVVLLYGYIFNSIIFAFFSNWFYEEICSTTFIYYIVFWAIYNFIFCGKFFNKRVVLLSQKG